MILKNNQGTAIILSLIIVTLLFILTSFLIRKVVTNTMMVRKVKEEQESYAKAKQGILYALDRLNTWDGIDPDYNPTDWTPNEVGQGNWSDYSNYSLMVYKGYIPAPGGYTENEDYITIESRDLPKKLVTLQGIADYKSPLLKYVKFTNSDVTFSSPQTFGGLSNGSPMHVNGNLTLTGVNNIYLDTSGNDKFEIAREILPTASSDTVNILDQNGISLASNLNALAKDGGNNGFSLVYDTENSEWVREPGNFNTASGHYFDAEHLPSSFDRSDPDNPQYVSGKSIIFWPQINEERYENLADLLISASDCGNRGLAWNDWYPSAFSSGTYWKQDGSTDSYTYTPPGVHIVLTDQDLDNSDGDANPTTGKDMMVINDSITNDYPAEYDPGNSFYWSTYSSSQAIYAPGDIRLEGIIPSGEKITVVSKGVIYIEGNLYQGDSSSSLALLAKKNIVFNTTHRWVVNSPTSNSTIPNWDEWDDDAYLEGVTDTYKGSAAIDTETGPSIKRQVLDFGGGTTNNIWQVVSANHIVLHGCNWTVIEDTIQLRVEVSWDGSNWVEMVNESGSSPVLVRSNSGSDEIDAYIPSSSSYARVFRYLRISLEGDGDADDDQGSFSIDSIEIILKGVEGGVAVFSEEENWAIIPGNGVNSNNNQPGGLPLTFKGAFSEQRWEEKSKWDGTVSGDGQADWPNTIYRYDSNLSDPSNSPPALPPSVNLVSLRRKDEG